MANNFLDKDGLLYLWQKIKNKFVAQETGKGLSSNDYTTDEKTKLSGIAAGATKNIVEDVLTSTSTQNALSAKQGKELNDKITSINTNLESLGAGDMLKSVYDIDNNGKVDGADDADKLGGQAPSYYAKAAELSNYVLTSQKGKANGVASLGSDGKVPTAQLPETAPTEHTHDIKDVTGLNDALSGKSATGHKHTTSDITDFSTEMAKKANASHTHEITNVTGLETKLSDMVAVAEGKRASYVFSTKDEMNTWLADTSNTETLKTGDVFLIRATDVPDYWWDGTTNTPQILETTKVDLSTITNAEIDEIVAS